jgi:hypothetical protein
LQASFHYQYWTYLAITPLNHYQQWLANCNIWPKYI